ncbi:ABC transporter substrate-binding protein [Pelagibius sp. Alg239-R121]|uniref:ABC transporter substrate-binding protein n=1 Tax=Pelagibius sp. Alg239-R121 TaxID=2993448 RepID=UPI0024A72A63|nr:ABC transporter substrate-binding protein [Pelagibius sp. Alg239-R121]
MQKTLGYAILAVLAGASTALAEPSGTFRQAHELGFGSASSLDPISKGRVFQITEKIMNRLVRPGLDGKPTPDLAVSWTSNAEATEWTFELREGVKFHDGTAFDAEDVIYSLGRVQDPELDSPAASTIKMVEKIETAEGNSIKMILSAPYADLPLQLMDYRLRMIPSGSGDAIATSGIGTGPFKVVTFDAEGTTTLAANPDYWEGAPGVASMEIIGISDGQARLQALLGGQIDMLRGVTEQQRVLFEKSDKFALQDIPTGNWRGIVFRTDVPPFDDARVRKAVRVAADRQGLVDLVLGGGGVASCDTPAGPTDQYRAELTCPQNIEEAKRLLSEAGHPDGIEFDIHASSLEPSWVTLAEAYQQQVAPAGIKVNIVLAPTDGYWSDVWRKKSVAMTRWNQRPADQILHEAYLGGAPWNESYWDNKDFDGTLAAARRELDFNKRRALYIKVQEQLFDEGGTLVPYHVNKLVGTTARVKNLDAVVNDAVRWHMITVD